MTRSLSATAAHRLRRHLQAGGLVAYPTESSYGLGCLPKHAKALNRLMRLKKRPQHKGLIVVGSGLPQLQSLLSPLPPAQRQLAEHTWPAAVTLLLPVRTTLPVALRGKGRRKLAVRVPGYAPTRMLCRQLRTALVSTSCNRAGLRPCRSEREVRRQFGHRVWVVGGCVGGSKTPSRIVDAETGQRLR